MEILPQGARLAFAIGFCDPVVLHLDQVFLKPGKQGMGTNWHQDNAYFQIEDPLQGTAMWTAKIGFPLGKRPYLTGDAAAGGLNEHGGGVAGTWE